MSEPVFGSVREALDILTVQGLQKLLQYLPGKPPRRKAEMADKIARALEGKALRSLWSQLDELQQNAVREAAYAEDGHLSTEVFLAKYDALPDWGERASFMFEVYITNPSRLGLFLYSPESDFVGMEMPADLQKRIRAFVEPPPPFTLTTLDELPDAWLILWETFDIAAREQVPCEQHVPLRVREMERVAPQELQACLRAVQLGKLTASEKTSMPGKAGLRNAGNLLVGGDFYDGIEGPQKSRQTGAKLEEMRAFAWMMLLPGTNLAEIRNKKLQLTSAGRKALGSDPVKTLKSIWNKWLKTTLFDEMRRFRLIKGQTGMAQRHMTPPRKRREAIARVLKECPVDRWITIDDFVRYCMATGKGFDVSRSPETLDLSNLRIYVDFYDTAGSWTLLETAYLQCFLFEYAATLGAIDVAYINPFFEPNVDKPLPLERPELGQYDGLVAFRVNALGAYLLGLRSQYEASPVAVEPTLRVLPNLEIVLAGPPLSSTESLLLETYTKPTSDRVWTLDRGKLLAAVDSGQPLDDFRDYLRRASVGEIPATVEQLLDDISQRSQQLTDLGLVRYVECADATLAMQIAHDSRTKKYCQLAGDRHLVVPQESDTRFRNALRKLGYTLPPNRS